MRAGLNGLQPPPRACRDADPFIRGAAGSLASRRIGRGAYGERSESKAIQRRIRHKLPLHRAIRARFNASFPRIDLDNPPKALAGQGLLLYGIS